GFYILLERPFYIGDQINMTSGMTTFTGKVEDIQLRVTKLRLISGEEVAIPNMLIFANAVVNNTFYGERRATVLVTLPQEAFTPEETQQQMTTILRELDQVMEKPEPQVIFSGIADGKVTLTLRFWVASGQNIDISRIVYKLYEVLPTAELTIKEPLGSV
ncbi:MAG: mechanosensitive ion channel family protein, partial [Ktedonobacteraceae bacterium]|nr:mechanosensitive ion channel family protein [Ktedonobacteraceae bacterium]